MATGVSRKETGATRPAAARAKATKTTAPEAASRTTRAAGKTTARSASSAERRRAAMGRAKARPKKTPALSMERVREIGTSAVAAVKDLAHKGAAMIDNVLHPKDAKPRKSRTDRRDPG